MPPILLPRSLAREVNIDSCKPVNTVSEKRKGSPKPRKTIARQRTLLFTGLTPNEGEETIKTQPFKCTIKLQVIKNFRNKTMYSPI